MSRITAKSYAPTPPCQVAFIGLGIMGYPMAGHLARAGHRVTVYNRSMAKALAWCSEFSGTSAATPRAAAQDADLVFCCVGNDDDLRAVTLGESGAFAGMKPGTIFVDHTTASATQARALHATARAQSLQFVDAPVSGGQAGAQNGALSVMCGGDAVAFEAGLDMNQVLDVIGAGAAQSWQLDNRGKSMMAGQFDFGFAVDWMRKDLGLVLDEARRNGAALPVTALVDQFYADVQAMGGRQWDTSSLIKRLKQ